MKQQDKLLETINNLIRQQIYDEIKSDMIEEYFKRRDEINKWFNDEIGRVSDKASKKIIERLNEEIKIYVKENK